MDPPRDTLFSADFKVLVFMEKRFSLDLTPVPWIPMSSLKLPQVHQVILTGRTSESCSKAIASLLDETGCLADQLAGIPLELSQPESIREFPAKFKSLTKNNPICHILVNNAGAAFRAFTPLRDVDKTYVRVTTEDSADRSSVFFSHSSA
jgi:hypothetical protein